MALPKQPRARIPGTAISLFLLLPTPVGYRSEEQPGGLDQSSCQVGQRGVRSDQQINVFPDRESPDAVRSRLSDAQGRERLLRQENERYRQEETSVDHALAQLLANSDVKYTPFRREQKWSLKCDGVDILVEVLTSRTVPKTAVVFTIMNQDRAEPWKLMEARLSTAARWEPRPFALRLEKEQIAQGRSGRIAVVADHKVFESKQGPEQLILELFRSDGLQQVQVVLEERIARE